MFANVESRDRTSQPTFDFDAARSDATDLSSALAAAETGAARSAPPLPAPARPTAPSTPAEVGPPADYELHSLLTKSTQEGERREVVPGPTEIIAASQPVAATINQSPSRPLTAPGNNAGAPEPSAVKKPAADGGVAAVAPVATLPNLAPQPAPATAGEPVVAANDLPVESVSETPVPAPASEVPDVSPLVAPSPRETNTSPSVATLSIVNTPMQPKAPAAGNLMEKEMLQSPMTDAYTAIGPIAPQPADLPELATLPPASSLPPSMPIPPAISLPEVAALRAPVTSTGDRIAILDTPYAGAEPVAAAPSDVPAYVGSVTCSPGTTPFAPAACPYQAGQSGAERLRSRLRQQRCSLLRYMGGCPLHSVVAVWTRRIRWPSAARAHCDLLPARQRCDHADVHRVATEKLPELSDRRRRSPQT